LHANVASRGRREKTECSDQPALFLQRLRLSGCISRGSFGNPARFTGVIPGPRRVLFLCVVRICADLRLSVAARLGPHAETFLWRGLHGCGRRILMAMILAVFLAAGGLDFSGASGLGQPSQPGCQFLHGAGVDTGPRWAAFSPSTGPSWSISNRVSVFYFAFLLLIANFATTWGRKLLFSALALVGADPDRILNWASDGQAQRFRRLRMKVCFTCFR